MIFYACFMPTIELSLDFAIKLTDFFPVSLLCLKVM